MTTDEYKALSNLERWYPRWVYRGYEPVSAVLESNGWVETGRLHGQLALRITLAGMEALKAERCSGKPLDRLGPFG